MNDSVLFAIRIGSDSRRDAAQGADLAGQGHDAAANERDQLFIVLVERELRDAYRLGRYVLGDAGEAEDAAQEAILQAWRAWPGMRDPDRFSPWFERILMNICFGRLRQRRRSTLVELPIAEIAASEDAHPALERDEISQALARLTAEQRVVVVLRYWRDLTIPEIARRLRVPEGTVKSRLHYALASIRSQMQGPGEAAGRQ